MDFNNIINLSCDIEYNNYKKKLIKKLFIQLQFIINIFDNEFNDNIIKLYILMKKNKLNSNFSTFIKSLYDLVIEINNLKYIDQFDFLNIIIKLIRIYSLTLIITNNDNSSIIKLINWKLVYDKIIDCVINLASNNRIIDLFVNLNNIDNNIKLNMKILATITSWDFFMYYSSTEIHKILYSKLLFNNNLNDPINKLPNIIIKYKKYFINEYRLKYNIYTELYSEIKKSTISKYKFIITSTNFIEVINDFIAINNNL